MNGFAPPFPQPAAAWQEHKTPEGRAYYYNSVTKVTQWTKPEEMMSLAEVSEWSFLVLSLSSMANELICPTARSTVSALERVHRRGWSQVLVQYRDAAELLGDA